MKLQAQLSSGTKGLNSSLFLHLIPLFVYAGSEGQRGRLCGNWADDYNCAWCDKYRNSNHPHVIFSGLLSARQRNAIRRMAFCWRDDSGPRWYTGY